MAEGEAPKIESNNQEPELLCEIEQHGYRLCLFLTNSLLECRADLSLLPEDHTPSEQDSESPEDESDDLKSEPFRLAPAELIQLLLRYNIKRGINFEALYNFCAAVEEGIEQQSILLATGTAPRTGEDGWFELLFKTSGDAEFEEDEHGNVDLRTRHAFSEIEAGQKIGMLHLPHKGYPGETVHGIPIPAERGRIYSLIAGEGVELKYDGRIAFAEREGRALLERQVLSVVDQWVISGDVDLKVGNIDFHGFVEVKGDVLDDFNVKATKGIKVSGVVGACRLESNGSIEIGSMAGKEIGTIICHGDLVAGYLNQANVFCYGNVLAKNEIRNSIIKSTGKITVERGSIVGGSCVALEGIEAKILGATSGLATHLTAGIYFPDADRFNFLRKSLKNIDEQIKRLKASIGPLEKLHDLDETMAKRLSILTEQWEKLEIEKDAFSAELAASTKQERENINPKINVGSELREGVTICLGDSSHKYKIERKGPMSIIENTRKGGFRYLSMSPLQKIAAELEEEILEQEAVAVVEEGALEESSADDAAGGDPPV